MQDMKKREYKVKNVNNRRIFMYIMYEVKYVKDHKKEEQKNIIE